MVTRADRPRGRGQRTSEPPVKARAIAAGLPVLQPERLKDDGFLAAFAAFDPDLVVLAAYGKILTDAVLATPRLGVLNVHASLLPRYRGAAPVHRAVINGDRETGVTIMKMVKALDAGPMLAAARHPIGPDDTSEDVERALGRIGAQLLVATVDALAAGPVAEVATGRCRGHLRAADHQGRRRRRLDPARRPHPRSDPRPVSVAARVHVLPRPPADPAGVGGRKGVGSRIDRRPGRRFRRGPFSTPKAIGCELATGEGTLAITRIQAEGRRPMTTREFLAGHPLAAGEILTPHP